MILDRNGRPRWHDLWTGNPRIAKPTALTGREIRIRHGAHCRPYVDYARMRVEFAAVFPGREYSTKVHDPRLPWRFTDARCRRGELPGIARREAGGYVVVEPHCKPIAPNRDWGWERWQALADSLPDLDWVQINPQGARLLRGARHMPAPTFRAACEILSGAALYVGPEGGLYHAAAALGVPAVAIFGGYVSPENQGYDSCVNLYEDMEGESPCGQRVTCSHCTAAMARIGPERVAAHVTKALQR